MPVPIAIIVCEGDLNTINEVKQALEHKLPVIIMKGSGKAADLVLEYIDKYFLNIVSRYLAFVVCI